MAIPPDTVTGLCVVRPSPFPNSPVEEGFFWASSLLSTRISNSNSIISPYKQERRQWRQEFVMSTILFNCLSF